MSKMQLRMTPQRMATMEYLRGNTCHLSASEVCRAVPERFPTMSLAAVYNALDKPREKGQLKELSMDRGKKPFDPDAKPHHHLICLSCNEIIDIHADLALGLSVEETGRYRLSGITLTSTVCAPAVTRKTNLNSAYSATIHNSSSTPLTLAIMTGVAIVFVPVAILYQGWAYKVFSYKITEKELKEGEHY